MSYQQAAATPLYCIDYENETELLGWINDIVQWRALDPIERQRIDKQTVSLALYLNYAPFSHKVLNLSNTGGGAIFQKKEYVKLIDPLIGVSINDWVSRLTARKPTFSVFPKDYSDPVIKSRSDIAKSVLESTFQEQRATEMDELNLRNSFIMGESYIEVRWNPEKGPLDQEVQKALENGEDLEPFAGRIRIGDKEFRIHDSRNVIVQRAHSYRDSEWVILPELLLTLKLKKMYPEFEEDIQDNFNPQIFGADVLTPPSGPGYAVLYTLYHRPCDSFPKGLIVKATQERVLSMEDYPSEKWVKNNRFPVLQLTDLDVIGSSRGSSSTVMDTMSFGQIAYNNAWIQALTNLMYLSPKLMAEEGSIDYDHLRTGDRTVLITKRGKAKPSFLAQEMVSQGHLLLLDKLKACILKAANVMPISHGDSMPNVESRKMQDFYEQQENSQSIPKDVKHNRFLTDWATITLELMGDKFKDDQQRSFQYFGKLKRNNVIETTGDSLQVDVNVYVETLNSMSTTLQGRLQEISQIMSVAPGYYTQAEAIDRLDIGSPEKLYSEITNAEECASYDIDAILSGKDVPSPTKQLDLLAYYGVYRREIQKREIRALLPEIFNPLGEDIGNKILSQIATIEDLIIQMLNDKAADGPNGMPILKGDMPVILTQLNVPRGTTYKQYLYGKYPTFPCVFNPEPVIAPNPLLAAQSAVPMMPPPQMPMGGAPQPSGNPMGPPNQGM